MPQIMKLNTEKARLDPASVFATPLDLVNEIGLTRGQKLATLDRWQADVEAQIAATGEGMPAAGAVSSEAAVLEEISRARQAVLEQRSAGGA